MDQDLALWLWDQGFEDGMNATHRRVLPTDEQQQVYDAGFEEGAKEHENSYCPCCGRSY